MPTIVVVTKTDKLKASQVAPRLLALAGELELDDDQLIAFSATTGAGRDDLAEAVMSLIAQPSWKTEA